MSENKTTIQQEQKAKSVIYVYGALTGTILLALIEALEQDTALWGIFLLVGILGFLAYVSFALYKTPMDELIKEFN